MGQLTIFDIYKNNSFSSILEQLKEYGIDEYYRKHYKGKYELLSSIRKGLEQLPNYYEYRNKMFELLKDHFKNREDVELIYYKEYDYIRIFEFKASYPLYCLEMINREII